MIAGAGENCNKFELELLIANKLKEIGYKVSIVTSRSHVNCLGVHSFPTFMFQSLKDENEKIIAYNNYIKYLSEIDKPDIFVLGVPGGILPITRRQPEHFGIFAFEVFNSVKPDYMIFNLYNADVERKYLSEMKMLMKYRFDVDIDAFYISNYIQDGLSLNTFMPIKYIRQEQQDVEEKWEKFGEGIYYKSKITLLVENLIQTLNGYKEIEIL
jgi:peptide maturation system protein (TIGR04066 family)